MKKKSRWRLTRHRNPDVDVVDRDVSSRSGPGATARLMRAPITVSVGIDGCLPKTFHRAAHRPHGLDTGAFAWRGRIQGELVNWKNSADATWSRHPTSEVVCRLPTFTRPMYSMRRQVRDCGSTCVIIVHPGLEGYLALLRPIARDAEFKKSWVVFCSEVTGVEGVESLSSDHGNTEKRERSPRIISLGAHRWFYPVVIKYDHSMACAGNP